MKVMSQTAYAKHIKRSQQYVSKLVQQGKIPTVNGKIDPAAADAARIRNRERMTPVTRPAPDYDKPASLRVYQAPSNAIVRLCAGCGGRYTEALAREFSNPDPEHFCTRECRDDVRAHKTREQIRNRLRKDFLAGGYSQEEVMQNVIFDWVDADGIARFPF